MRFPDHCGLCHVDIEPSLAGFLAHIRSWEHNSHNVAG